MRTNLNPLMYRNTKPLDWLKTTPGTYPLILQPGQYNFTLCGAGGAGGTNSAPSNAGYFGTGGGGGNGSYVSQILDLPYGASLTITVPAGGLTFANGGNGGAAGVAPWAGSSWGGAGGGGGMPAVIQVSTNVPAFFWGDGLYTYLTDNDRVYDKNGNLLSDWSVVWVTDPDFALDNRPTFTRKSDNYVYTPIEFANDTLPFMQYIYANGGGGGGGAGGGGGVGRNVSGAGGGGGGGYYYFDATTSQITSVPGKAGAPGGNGAGTAGNPQFPKLYSGAGGNGAGASGGGASGGGGHNGWNSGSAYAGGGGGGAPGSPTAHGGGYGTAITVGATGSNYSPTGSPSINPDGEEVPEGFGAGGNTNQNGYPGWVRVIQIPKPKSVQDLGLVTESISTIRDNGLVPETVDAIQDMGGIK